MFQVTDTRQFRSLIERGVKEFLIVLACGVVSRRRITHFRGTRKYAIEHATDGSREIVAMRYILRKSFIGWALKRGCLFVDEI